MTSLFDVHQRAMERTAAVIDAIEPEQYSLQTPCPDFTVRNLLAHLVSGNKRWIAMAHGEPAGSIPLMSELPDDQARSAYRDSMEELLTAWADPALLDKMVTLTFAEVTGAAALSIHTVESVVHGWDLGKSTGQPTEIPTDLCEAAWEHTRNIDESFRGPTGPFGPALSPPADATPTERLVAWLGRQP